MNKQDIYSLLIQKKSDDYQALTAEIKNIVKRVHESPSATESASDTSRSQNSKVADELNKTAQLLYKNIEQAKIFSIKTPRGKVSLGSLVNLELQTHQNYSVFILPFFGGELISSDGEDITIISPKAPLTPLIMERAPGYSFSLNGRSYIIKDTQ